MSNNFFRIIGEIAYNLFTEKKEEIKSKYNMVNYGFTNFMVVDNKGRHFNVNNGIGNGIQ